MKTPVVRLLLPSIFVLICCAPAFALRSVINVNPQWTKQKENGITVETTRRDDGTLAFVVTRTRPANEIPEGENKEGVAPTIQRVAHLEMRDANGVLLGTDVASEIHDNTLVYSFVLAPASISSTHFVLWEAPQPAIMATEYNFQLNEFAAPLLANDHK